MKKTQRYINGVPQVRPWVRFWARMFDIKLFGVFVYVLLFPSKLMNSFPYTTIEDISNESYMLLFLFIYIFVEAFLLSAWGNTPGKWLLNIKINGKNLSYSQAYQRSKLVWWRGFGIGVLEIITMPIAYYKLKKYGTTTWDRDLKLKISHKKIGLQRVSIFIFFYSLLIVWLAI